MSNNSEPLGILNLFQQMIQAAKQHNASLPGADVEPLPSNHLECLRLYDNGWKQDGFEHIENSTSIDTFWIKGEDRVKITLTFREQQMWVHELDKRKARGEI